MSQISDIRNPWRDILLSEPASFRGVIFHVETGARGSGRRVVLHEYPKRNKPYAEDMGLRARRFTITGYLIYRPKAVFYEYTSQCKRLIEALEADDNGWLMHPTLVRNGGMLAMCENFSMTESRERGGYTSFDMQFIEAGEPVNAGGIGVNTAAEVKQQADKARDAAVQQMNNNTPGQGTITITPGNGGQSTSG